MKDEHIEKELLKQNKIPGCDQLTRPEEIKALSKYLKNIRTTQENYTSLGKNNLEIPGITTGKLPEIDNLEDHIDTLKVANSVELVNGSISLDGDFKEVNNLRNFKDNLLDDRDISLDNHEEYIIDDRKISLEHIKEKLDIIDKNKLSSQKIKLINNKEINKLENTKKNLDIEENIDSLENFSNKINLSDKNDIKELNEHIEKLVNTEQDIVNSLERDKIYINNSNEITSLSNFKDSIEVQENKITELSNKKESLKNIKNQIINNISSYKEEIPNELKESDSLNTSNEKLRTPEELKNIYNEKIRLEGEIKDPNLSDYKEDFVGEIKDSNLSNYKEDFIGEIKDSNLSNYKEDFIGEIKDPNLSDYKEDFVGEIKDPNLSDYKEDFVGEIKDPNLSDYKEDFVGEIKDPNLSDYKESFIGEEKNIDLENDILNLPESSSNSPRENSDYNYVPYNEAALYEESIERPDSKDGPRLNNDNNYVPQDNAALYEESIERPDSKDGPRLNNDNRILSNDKLDSYNNIKDVNEGFLYEAIIESSNPINENDIEEKIKGESISIPKTNDLIVSEDNLKDLIEKNENNKILLKDINKNSSIYEEDTLEEMPSYSLPKFNIDSLNLNNYIRWTAEKTVGQLNGGKGRDLLMDETISALVAAREKLEKLSKSNRDRLPGNDSGLLSDLVSGGISGALDNLGNRIGDAISSNFGKEIDIKNPINRPDGENYTEGWVNANNRSSSSDAYLPTDSGSEYSQKEGDLLTKITNPSGSGNSSNSFWKKLGETALDTLTGVKSGEKDYSFKTNYVSGKGIRITLEELCENSPEMSNSGTVEGLINLLKASPFITTTNKFTSDKDYGYRTQTLDTNNYWELTLEPYVGVENGNMSYLPGIHEINAINIAQHGVNTAYNRWIPYTSFDLQKSKMTSKTLSLYDGEISYPISMEFTNEFRLTIADDQYKSWRTYFERCAQVAIYNSEGHDENYYKNGGSGSTLEITAIDTSNVCIAMYKNICFRCRIYVMTPQYSTIRKFDLLLVLKDFSEEYTGDVDGGAGDLTVSFSIVGENPSNAPMKVSLIQQPEEKKQGKDYSSIIEGGVNSIIGLIK